MTLQFLPGGHVKGTYINFRLMGTSPSGLTRQFDIYDERSIKIGTVSWFARWRKYTFNPGPMTVYEETCLREIAEFLEHITKEHRFNCIRAKVSTSTK